MLAVGVETGTVLCLTWTVRRAHTCWQQLHVSRTLEHRTSCLLHDFQ